MKNSKGITLIALVVTIVVLLILAGVSISMLTGENGIITQAQKAKLETRGGEVEERITLWKNEVQFKKYSNDDDINVKTESEILNELLSEEKVYEDEINEEDKTITIGTRVISYKIGEDLKESYIFDAYTNKQIDTIKFKEGMTWKEFCSSEYNTMSITIDEEFRNGVLYTIYNNSGYETIAVIYKEGESAKDGENILPTDEIKEKYNYEVYSGK